MFSEIIRVKNSGFDEMNLGQKQTVEMKLLQRQEHWGGGEYELSAGNKVDFNQLKGDKT